MFPGLTPILFTIAHTAGARLAWRVDHMSYCEQILRRIGVTMAR